MVVGQRGRLVRMMGLVRREQMVRQLMVVMRMGVRQMRAMVTAVP